MFAEFAKKLGTLFVATEDHERDAYLASSVDFVDLEHRMRNTESNHYSFGSYSSGAPREWNA